jgi:15-cis-phytoene synthase
MHCSRITTRKYSTSFSLGILSLAKDFRDPIYAIYGFVRFADEIVDTFHSFNKDELINRFEEDTWKAIQEKISLNPILQSFQITVNQYQIDHSLIKQFLHSMRMDLDQKNHNQSTYEEYILGSAEVVGLMCLHVFTNGNNNNYKTLKPFAMALGAAFQKINFLRDLNADFKNLGRSYFPELNLQQFNESQKQKIEQEIETDFKMGLEGIRLLPYGARFGVYVAYVYYLNLFEKIRSLDAAYVMQNRIRIPNIKKYSLLFGSYLKHTFNLI